MEEWILTEEDKDQLSYKACVGGAVLTGMATGSIAGGILGSPITAPLGGLAGLIMGLKGCKYLNEPIKKKLFSARNERLSDHEIAQVLKEIKRQKSFISKKQSMALLGEMRSDISKNNKKYSS